MERASVRKVRGGETANEPYVLATSDSQEVSTRVDQQANYRPAVIFDEIERGVRELASVLATIPKQVAEYGQPETALCCSMSGSRRPVTVRANANDGRKAVFILGPAIAFDSHDSIAASAASPVIHSISQIGDRNGNACKRAI